MTVPEDHEFLDVIMAAVPRDIQTNYLLSRESEGLEFADPATGRTFRVVVLPMDVEFDPEEEDFDLEGDDDEEEDN